jgi:hypothetical protein
MDFGTSLETLSRDLGSLILVTHMNLTEGGHSQCPCILQCDCL